MYKNLGNVWQSVSFIIVNMFLLGKPTHLLNYVLKYYDMKLELPI